MDIKICIKCNEGKLLDNFRIRSINGKRINICKNCESKLSIQNYNENKEKRKQSNKNWRDLNADKLKSNSDRFLKNNPDYQKTWFINNKGNINIRNKKRRDSDPKYRVKENVRNLIKNSITYRDFKKNTKTSEILGCTTEELRQYLESKFESWMSWDNYGNPKDRLLELNKSWDIDHIIPLSLANTEDELIKLNHYTNLQPLCSYVNRIIKRAKINTE